MGRLRLQDSFSCRWKLTRACLCYWTHGGGRTQDPTDTYLFRGEVLYHSGSTQAQVGQAFYPSWALRSQIYFLDKRPNYAGFEDNVTLALLKYGSFINLINKCK
jgi:hypothetical protein